MKIPYLEKKVELKSCHDVTWEDNYSWIHQKNILDVLKDKSKLNPEVKKPLRKNLPMMKKNNLKLAREEINILENGLQKF